MPSQQDSAARPAPVTFAAAVLYWLRLGCISFGGPAGQIAIMHEDLVERRRWISERRFLHALNYTMVLPGPEAQQLATYIGWLLHGTAGGIIAGGLFVLPSLLLITTLAWLYLVHRDLPVIAGAFYGIKPVVVAAVVAAAWRIGSRSLTTAFTRALAAAAFAALTLWHVPFPWIVLAAAIAGAAAARYRPHWIAPPPAHTAAIRNCCPALIDDDTPVPSHARFTWPRALAVAGTGLLLWAATLAALWLYFGAGTYTAMGWFFTKAALLTFGGAYAVLPYVYQGAVVRFGWLDATQMIDGLALGETTPGPLIMVVTFVGFIGGWNAAPPGADTPFQAGLAGALTATWFTFLPSFIFIFLGAPAVESTRHLPHVNAPLAAITAAIAGVIANLAVFFARHVFWPGGVTGPPDPYPALLALAAIVAMLRLRASIIPLIGAAAALGIAMRVTGVAA